MASTNGITLMGGRSLSELNLVGYLLMMVMLTKSSDHLDVQEKVKRVVTQGHIDPEDFKGVSGDPIHCLRAGMHG
jgi:hypothetical protein